MSTGMEWEKFWYHNFAFDLRYCSLATKGFWIFILIHLWGNGGRGDVTGSYEDFGRIASCQPKEAKNAIAELEEKGVCEVIRATRLIDPVKQKCIDDVTLINRRLKREQKERENTRLRVAEFRKRGPVTLKKRFENAVEDKKIRRIEEKKLKEATEKAALSLKPTEEQKKELASLCIQVNSKFGMRFNSFAWIQKSINLNPKTHLHVLNSLLQAKEVQHPWAYANQIAAIENGNYNERDHTEMSNKFKTEDPNRIGFILNSLITKKE